MVFMLLMLLLIPMRSVIDLAAYSSTPFQEGIRVSEIYPQGATPDFFAIEVSDSRLSGLMVSELAKSVTARFVRFTIIN